jgi:hypothetical protein
MTYSIPDIDDYKKQLSEDDKPILIEHCNEHNIPPVICAWYDDIDDFYSDWVDEVGYSKKQADDLLRDNKDSYQFVIFNDGRILRLSL